MEINGEKGRDDVMRRHRCLIPLHKILLADGASILSLVNMPFDKYLFLSVDVKVATGDLTGRLWLSSI